MIAYSNTISNWKVMGKNNKYISKQLCSLCIIRIYARGWFTFTWPWLSIVSYYTVKVLQLILLLTVSPIQDKYLHTLCNHGNRVLLFQPIVWLKQDNTGESVQPSVSFKHVYKSDIYKTPINQKWSWFYNVPRCQIKLQSSRQTNVPLYDNGVNRFMYPLKYRYL